MRTRNQIVSDFKLFADLHLQINTFMYGQDFEQIANENINYPLMFVVPVSTAINST